MEQYAIDTHIKNGHLELNNLPFADHVEVRVVVVPKVKLSTMSFKKAQQLTQSLKGNLSDDIDTDRNER